MLQAMVKRTKGLLTAAVVLMVVIVMAFFGVAQKASGPQGGGVAAIVNGEAITRNEFNREFEMRLYQIKMQLGGQIDERLLTQFQIPKNTLENMVQTKLLAQEATRLHVLVSDAELVDNIRTMYSSNGKFDAEAYRTMPDRGAREKAMREQMQVERLQKYVADRVKFTPAAVKQAFVMKDSKMELEFAKIDLSKLGKDVKVSAAEAAQYAKETPEADLQNYYQSNLSQYSEPEQIKLRQIRVGIPFQASPEKKAEAKKKIEAAAQDLTPANFAERAKTHSDDEFAKKGGDAGWVKRGTLDRALETYLDTAELGKVSAPIETTFGHYLVIVESKKPKVTKTFEEVKLQIAEKLAKEKKQKAFAENKRKEWDSLLAQGKALDGELKKAGYELVKTGPFSPGDGHMPKLLANDAIWDEAFELTKASPVAKKLIPLNSDFVYLKLVSFEPAKKANFAKESASLGDREAYGIQSDLVRQWVDSLKTRAKITYEMKFTEAPETVIQ